MTFLELCQAVRRECGIQGTGPAAVTSQTGLLSRVVNWVIDADNLIQSMNPDWNFLWAEFTGNTTLASSYLTKPADFGMWDREAFAIARGTADGRPLSFVDFQDWRRSHGLKVNAEPSSITILPDNNLAFPAPANGTHEIYGNYWKVPVKLAANTDVSPIPLRFHRIIVARAKMWYFEDIESDTQFTQAENEFDYWLKLLEGFSLPNRQEATQSSPDDMVVRPE